MALIALIVKFSDLWKRSRADACATAEPQEQRKTMTDPPPRPRRRKPLEAGPLAPEIGSFRLHLAAEGKAPKTVRACTGAVAWFAAAHLIPRTRCTRWEEVSSHDVQRWMVHRVCRPCLGAAYLVAHARPWVLGGCAEGVPTVILPKVRDPRFVTVRRGGTLTDSDQVGRRVRPAHVRRRAYRAAARRAAAPRSATGRPVPDTTAGMKRAVSGACGCKVSFSTPVAVL